MCAAFEYIPREYPQSPGVYLMKDSSGRIIYIGKAKSLRKRLSSYFQAGRNQTVKTKVMLARIARIDTLLVSSEKEALLLEASLIKKHRPRYNIVLKDDKSYVLFRLNKKSDFPRLTMTRKVVRDGSAYFGPFTSAASARITWKLISKTFPLRKCTDSALGNRVRPCLYHHINQCLAPCVKEIDKETYREMVQQVEMLLSGRTGELIGNLKREMRAASDGLDYEKAALCRDQIRAVERTVERQVAVLPGSASLDIAAVAETGDGLGLGLVFVRQGRMLDQKIFFWPGLSLEDGPEVVQSFVSQFYRADRFIPGRIVVPFSPDSPALAEALTDLVGHLVKIETPSGSKEKELMLRARKIAGRASEKKDNSKTMLRDKLRLAKEPERIECVDVSHLGGRDVRVGQVVYENGRRNPEATRVYSFPELEGTSDDYAALAAWAGRRLESGPPWPDLVLIDGGVGQISAVQRGLSDAGADVSWELASIAKGPSRRAGELEDSIFRPGRKNHLNLKPGSPELLLLQRMRDEAHRFVIGRQRKARKKHILQSELMGLPGIGPKTARLLWDRFSSLDEMVEAGIEEIGSLPGIGKKKAENIRSALDDLKRSAE